MWLVLYAPCLPNGGDEGAALPGLAWRQVVFGLVGVGVGVLVVCVIVWVGRWVGG